MTHIICVPLSTAGLISTHRAKNHLLCRALSKCLIWARCFITWHGGRIYLERRLTGKPPSTLNPKLFLPAQWQVPGRRSKPIGTAGGSGVAWLASQQCSLQTPRGARACQAGLNAASLLTPHNPSPSSQGRECEDFYPKLAFGSGEHWSKETLSI